MTNVNVLQREFENTLGELIKKIDSKVPAVTCADVSFFREGMVNKRFESDCDIVFKLYYTRRQEDMAIATKHNCEGYISVVNHEKTISVMCSFKIPPYIDNVQDNATRVCDKLTLVKTTTSIPIGHGGITDLHITIWNAFIRVLASRWDGSYAGRSVFFTDYPADQEVERDLTNHTTTLRSFKQ